MTAQAVVGVQAEAALQGGLILQIGRHRLHGPAGCSPKNRRRSGKRRSQQQDADAHRGAIRSGGGVVFSTCVYQGINMK